MIRFGARIAPFAAAALVVVGIAPAALARPAARPAQPAHQSAAHVRPDIIGDLAGYLWSELDPVYDFDGQIGSISIASISTGNWDVTLGNLGPITGGIVQVTPYDVRGTCSVGSWFPSGSDLTVNVRCYSLSGHPANMLFDLLVTQPTTPPAGTFDYAWVYRDTNSGKLTGSYEYNSAHKVNTVRHLGRGRYQVTFPGNSPGGMKGAVKVSAYGVGGGDCVTSGWTGSHSGLVVDVNCYTAAGKPANRMFDVTYASRTNLMGLVFPTVNALVSSTGHVQAQVNSQPKAHVVVVHTKRGLYTVDLDGTPEQFSGGDVQVSPVASRYEHCVVTEWLGQKTKTVVTVNCFDNQRRPVDSGFTLEFVEGFLT
jgi:hypothetical protein